MNYRALMLAAGFLALTLQPAAAQHAPGTANSANVKLVAHVPLAAWISVSDIEIEQELSRPYAYVAVDMHGSEGYPTGVDIISLKDLSHARVIKSLRLDNPELHKGAGSLNPEYFKSHGRYYLTGAFQFDRSGPDAELGAVVWDVTGLPDSNSVKEVARITGIPYGFHESFAYKHSNGQALFVGTSMNGPAYVYDIDKVAAAGQNGAQGLVARIPVPPDAGAPAMIPVYTGYHDFYIGYDPVSHQDRFYGAGPQAYYVYDITNLAAPKLLTSVSGVAGIPFGHTFTPDPTGRYVVAETEYQYAPLRIFDLKPGLDGTVQTISRPIGAWTADWKHLSHNHEVRWPYVFVAALEDGLQVFNMMDPTNPYTVGFYDTYDGPDSKGLPSPMQGPIFNGAWGVDVRNADGLVVVSDFSTGFWALHMEGFDGWNGHQWGVPNVSSAQDWDKGPEGVPQKTT